MDIFYESYMLNRCEIRKRFTLARLVEAIKYFLRRLRRAKDYSSWSNMMTIKSTTSFDDEISKKGAIIDNMGNAHTTAHSYKNYLKENNLVIRDWTEGTNKSSDRQFKGCDINDIPNF